MSERQDRDWEAWAAEALKGRTLREPPAAVVRRAIALGHGLRSRSARGLDWLVELLFDSTAQPLPAGVRGAAGAERRCLYGARRAEASCQVDLRLARGPRGAVELTGQILPPPKGGWVEATIGKSSRRRKLGKTGEFVFRRLPGHARTLKLEILGEDARSLVIDDVPLPEPDGEDA